MSAILTDLSPASLATAIKANFYALFATLRGSSKAAALDCPPGMRWHTQLPLAWFNGVLSQAAPDADAAQIIGDTLAYFQARGVASFTWWLAPHLEPATWSPELLPHGFEYNAETPGMALNLAALPPRREPPVTIQVIDTSSRLAEWIRTFALGYGFPEALEPTVFELLDSLGTGLPNRYYLGYLNGQPVATATLFLGAGVAGIYNVATLEAARRQGIGAAMSLAALYDARDLGYQVGTLQASEMGQSVYRRLGFQAYCQMDHFVWSEQKPEEVG